MLGFLPTRAYRPGTPGATTFLSPYQEPSTTVGTASVIMTNAERGGEVAVELSRRIQIAYEWDSIAGPVPRGYEQPVQRTVIAVAEEILEAYVGE